MTLVVWLLVFGVVVGIAAVVVVREAGRMGGRPPPALFDADDAFEWVVAHVPDDVAATLNADDVRRILAFQLELFQECGVSTNGNSPASEGGVVVGGPDEIVFIVDRAAATGEAYLPEQVQGVIDTQLAYLQAIGAIGPVADDAGEASV